MININSDEGFPSDGLATALSSGPVMEPPIEQMIAYACNTVGDSSLPLTELPVELARMAPGAPALQLALVLASAADATQGMFGPTGESGRRAEMLWKQAAMIGVDVHYLSLQAEPHATAQDLLSYWTKERAAAEGA